MIEGTIAAPTPSLPRTPATTEARAFIALPWVGTVYWRCQGEAGSTTTRNATTVVMNWHPGATITARYELDSGEARSRVLQPYDGQLSTPFTPSRRHLWTVVWEHKPGRVTTTIEVTFAGGVECVDPPATELSIATD